MTWLTGKRPVAVDLVPTELVTAESRATDHLIRAVFAPRGARPRYLHVEVQSGGDHEMGLRMLEYWVKAKRQFSSKGEEPVTVSSYVIYLSRSRYIPDRGVVDESDGEGTKCRFRYVVLKLWEIDPATVLRLESPGLAPLAPLMNLPDPVPAVIESRRKIAKADRRRVSRRTKVNLFAALEAFAGLVVEDRRLLHRIVWEGLMDMEESVGVQNWIERGVQKARRGALVTVLRSRFGRVGKKLRARILEIDDVDLLERLIERAAVVPSLAQFSAEMPS